MPKARMERPTLGDWLSECHGKGRLDGSRYEAAMNVADRVAQKEPALVQAVALFGAWLSALFAIVICLGVAGLMGVSAEVIEHWQFWLIAGGSLAFLSWVINISRGHAIFLGHLAGALGVAGLAAMAVGLVMLGVWAWREVLAWGDPNAWLSIWVLPLGALTLAVVRCGGFDKGTPCGEQLTIATSVIGQVLVAGTVGWAAQDIAGWLTDTSPSLGEPVQWRWFLAATWLTQSALAVWLYRIGDHPLHRGLIAAAWFLMAYWVIEVCLGDYGGEWPLPGRLALLGLYTATTALIVLVFNPWDRLAPTRVRLGLRPAGYVGVVTVAVLAGENLLFDVGSGDQLWAYRVVPLAAAAYLTLTAAKATERDLLEPALWVGVVGISLAFVSTPGVVTALLIVALGLIDDRRVLRWFGLVALGFHLYVFYYLMAISLFDKSLMLMATGFVLLGLRACLMARPWYRWSAA